MNSETQNLDQNVIRWINKQGWKELRSIQKESIQPILSADTDLIISASTASGKSEAFFLPAVSAIVNQNSSVGILYISPLKALINDQYRRFQGLCEMSGIPCTPWHGDVSQSKKKKLMAQPRGVLLITPESIEAQLINNVDGFRKMLKHLKYICIDEFHAFIGTVRGQHLSCLLDRLECLIDRIENPVPRIGLSATLGGETEILASLVRPNNNFPCKIIIDSGSRNAVRVELKGIIVPKNSLALESSDNEIEETKSISSDSQEILNLLFENCRKSSNLVFPNAKGRVELLSARLKEMSLRNYLPNEFFPHHGSLAKDKRESVESRMQDENAPPTTVVCTTTLELGIDIGKVDAVYQVYSPPNSVSSLRQRYGRSGRRSTDSVLTMYILEKEIDKDSNILDCIRPGIVQSLAMLSLIVNEGWYEPPDNSNRHLSTFFHQVLAVIAQWGSVEVFNLYQMLCKVGPFKKITTDDFKTLLSHLGEASIIEQLHSGELTLGSEGNKIVDHYSFYSVFKTPVEYLIQSDRQRLGSIPVTQSLMEGQNIVFAGDYWKIIEINESKKIVFVSGPLKGGRPPRFTGDGIPLHDRIVSEMFKIYCAGKTFFEDNKGFELQTDSVADTLFQEGIEYFNRYKLPQNRFLEIGNRCFLFTWRGTKITNTLSVLLRRDQFHANMISEFCIEVENAAEQAIKNYLIKYHIDGQIPSSLELARSLDIGIVKREKYDRYLPDSLSYLAFASRDFDTKGVEDWIRNELL